MDREVIKVDEQGRICLSPETRKKYGITPNAELTIEEGRDSFLLHSPESRLGRIYVEPTNRCNLECATCIRHVWEEPLGNMKWETYLKVLDALGDQPPIPEIFFGGFGEPLSHPRIVDMIRAAKEKGASVELITNGTLLSEEMAHQMLDAELDWLWVSIDGATPKSYADVRLGNLLPKILDNINYLRRIKYRLNKSKPNLGISFVAMKRNIADLPAIVDMSIDLNANRLMISNVLPYSPDMKKEVLYSRSVANWRYKFNRVSLPRIDMSDYTQAGIRKLLTHYEMHELVGQEFLKPHDTCPFIEKGSVSVRLDGKVSPCLPLLHSHSNYLEDRLRVIDEHFFGSLDDQSLKSIWDSQEYADFRKRVQQFDFSPCTTCNSCELAESNREDCFGTVPLTCGGCLWGQGFIQCP